MRGKAKCSKSSLESRRLEPRSNDRLYRTLMRRQCISESLIPTEVVVLCYFIVSFVVLVFLWSHALA